MRCAIAVGLAAVCGLMVACGGIGRLGNARPVHKVDLAQFMKAHGDNPTASVEAHADDLVEFTGYVQSVSTNHKNDVFALISPQKEGGAARTAQVFFLDSSLARELKGYPKGSRITLQAQLDSRPQEEVILSARKIIEAQ